MSSTEGIPPIPTEDVALLLIDLQNGFLHPDGWVARLSGSLPSCLTATVEPARRALEAARAADVPVIHTKHAWQPGYADGGFLIEEIYPRLGSRLHEDEGEGLVQGSWDVEFFPPVAPIEGEHVIDKNRYDAFIATRLEQLLTRLGVRTLVVGGVVTTGCVESTVRHAAFLDYRVFLIEDAIGDAAQATHLDGLARMGQLFGHPTSVDAARAAWAPIAVA
jgi:ureidoacrylate peracid hydrolase